MPAIQYRASDGKRVPSVTSICKYADGDPGGLLHWANAAGLEGMTLDEARSTAQSVGTIVHACIEHDLRRIAEHGPAAVPTEPGYPNLDNVEPMMREQVDTALGAWEAWRSHVGGVEGAELSQVSETHRYGGTLDAVLRVRARRRLLDFKTGNGVYPSNLVQIAGYGLLWDELHPDEPIEEYGLLRLGKEDGSFHWKNYPAASMVEPKRAFLLARGLYESNRTLRKMIR